MEEHNKNLEFAISNNEIDNKNKIPNKNNMSYKNISHFKEYAFRLNSDNQNKEYTDEEYKAD